MLRWLALTGICVGTGLFLGLLILYTALELELFRDVFVPPFADLGGSRP